MAKIADSRRQFLKTAAAAGAVTFAAPYVKTSHSAGKLSMGVWDHWIPGTNEALQGILERWGDANGVEVTVDFITSQGNKILLTAQAESRAKTGHDIFLHGIWMPTMFAHRLEPVDDVVTDIISSEGPLVPLAEYLAKVDGVWRASPSPVGSQTHGMISRLDFYKEHAGIDLLEIFPGPGQERVPDLVDAWTYDAFLDAGQKLHAAGHGIGGPLGATGDASFWLAPVFAAHGAELVNKDGDIVVDSDEVRTTLEYLSRLVLTMPESIYAWDDAGNNRWMISGQGSSVFNPPSPWNVAKRDAPQYAEKMWCHDLPRGPHGRFRNFIPQFWGIWDFSENISAAKDMLRHVGTREVTYQMSQASTGYDVPLLISHAEGNDVWENAGPPPGVIYNYPIRGDEIGIAPGYPAPPPIAAQIMAQSIFPVLVSRVTAGGDSFDEGIKWAENELEAVMRS